MKTQFRKMEGPSQVPKNLLVSNREGWEVKTTSCKIKLMVVGLHMI